MEQYGYITFKSVSFAMKFETAIKKFDIKIRIIPVPRSISTSCGLCARFNIADKDRLESITKTHNLEYSHVYTDI
jgi:putative Se/S carrier protein